MATKKTAPKTSAPKAGSTFQTVFYLNSKEDSDYRFRATHVGTKRASKVILCNDDGVEPGQPCEVRVKSVKKPGAKRRGFIEVEYVRPLKFQLDDTVYIPEVLRRKLEAFLESGTNVLLDGPQGSGKTVLSRAVARALGLEYVFFNCSSVVEATDFVATLQIRSGPTGAAETVWMPTDIQRALDAARKDPNRRFLVFLDEFNRCREMARNGVMPALDSTRKIYNPITGAAEPITDNVLWIAAINNGAQFTGTTSVDPAQLDRFAPVRMDYPPEDAELKILAGKHPSVPRKTIRRVVRLANRVRQDEELGLDLSMRATEEVCNLLAHPNFNDAEEDPLPDILKDSFCARVTGSWDDVGTDAGLMWKVISGAL